MVTVYIVTGASSQDDDIGPDDVLHSGAVFTTLDKAKAYVESCRAEDAEQSEAEAPEKPLEWRHEHDEWAADDELSWSDRWLIRLVPLD